jgi:hypothetical protein
MVEKPLQAGRSEPYRILADRKTARMRHSEVVFRDKPAGLIVDYIGIAQSLKNALAQYSGPDQEQTGIDEEQAVAVMLEKHEIVCSMFHGFDYSPALAPDARPQQRLSVMAQAIDWVLTLQQARGREEARAPPLRGCRPCALKGFRARRSKRRSPRYS